MSWGVVEHQEKLSKSKNVEGILCHQPTQHLLSGSTSHFPEAQIFSIDTFFPSSSPPSRVRSVVFLSSRSWRAQPASLCWTVHVDIRRMSWASDNPVIEAFLFQLFCPVPILVHFAVRASYVGERRWVEWLSQLQARVHFYRTHTLSRMQSNTLAFRNMTPLLCTPVPAVVL